MTAPASSSRAPSRVLVVGPAWVGDMVMAQSLFAALKEMHPGAEIDVLAPRWTLPLLRFMPEVRQAIAQPLGHGELGLAARYRLGQKLGGPRRDPAPGFPGSVKAGLSPPGDGRRDSLRTESDGPHQPGSGGRAAWSRRRRDQQ